MKASDFVLDIVKNGYKVPFIKTPDAYSFHNRSSSLKNRSFVETEIKKLLDNGCIEELETPTPYCNPLHVAQQESGKLRLILDLSYLNKFIVKQSFKYEDIKAALQYFEEGSFVFTFDLKSAYHHIDLFEEHQKFFAFKWVYEDGTVRFFKFRVLVFGLSSAPYVFTKVTRQLVEYWRKNAIRIVLYLDDGIGGSKDKSLSLDQSALIFRTLCLAGFTPNMDKSIWSPTQLLTWLGWELNFEAGSVKIPSKKISRFKKLVFEISTQKVAHVKLLAKITGSLASFSFVIGSISRLMTRASYRLIASANSWNDFIFINPDVMQELKFWFFNVDRLNLRPFLPKSSTIGVVFSDASSKAFGGHFSVKCGRHFSFGSFSDQERSTSSTMREMLAVKYVLYSFIEKIAGYSVKWFTDNQNVVQIIKNGSKKQELQNEAVEIFNICLSRRVSIDMEWIPRTENEQADFISKIEDPDDWGISVDIFQKIELLWGPHSIDRFANFRNTKLARFNSLFWNPGAEEIDSFVQDWHGENNYVCPPIFLIPRVLRHMRNCKAVGTLVVPFWPSAIFWPLLMESTTKFNSFVQDSWVFPAVKESFESGSGLSMFGTRDLNFDMLALRISFQY